MSLSIAAAVSLFLLYTFFIGFHSIGPYNILRWIVCIYYLIVDFRWKNINKIIFWMFAAMAVLINPIIKFYIHRSDWQIIDIIYAIVIMDTALYDHYHKI